MNDLNGQLKREKIFHDNWAPRIDVGTLNVDMAFEDATVPENRYILFKKISYMKRFVWNIAIVAQK